MAIQEAQKFPDSQSNEMEAFSPKLPKDLIIQNNRLIQAQVINSLMFRKAMRNTPASQNTINLEEPFEFEIESEILHHKIIYKLEAPDKTKPQNKKFTISKTFSLSGPMRDMAGNELKDKGPFVTMATSLLLNDEDPHVSYSFNVSDDPKPKIYIENTQETVDKSLSLIQLLPLEI